MIQTRRTLRRDTRVNSVNHSAITHVIYIPGLGDGYDTFRQFLLKGWNRESLKVTFVPMNWSDAAEGFEAKYRRITEVISRVSVSDTIVLIGESAGGAMSLCVGLDDPRIDRIITICGKNRGAERVGASVYRKYPAFWQTMHTVDDVLETTSASQRARITTIYSPYDRTVLPIDTLIPGATPVKIYVPGHLLSIFLVLTSLRGYVIKQLV